MAINAGDCCNSSSSAGGDKHFRFEQISPSAVWNITHGLDKFPSVSVVDSAATEVTGKVEYPNNNEVVVTFNAAFTGQAFLN